MADKMAEKRCQMCGKPNPEHLEECQHCGARLKPLIASTGSSEKDAGANWANASPEDTLDWLRTLGQDDAPLDEAPPADDLPAWLRDATPQTAGATRTDWMDEDETSGVFDSNVFGDKGDWNVPDGDTKLNEWLPVDDEPVSETKDDNLDDFFRQKDSEEPTGSLPAWFTSREEEKTVPLSDMLGGQTFSEEGDWLDSLDSEDSVTTTVTDWKQPAPPPAKPADDLPAWLTTPAADASSDPDEFDDDLPSWLTGSSSGFEDLEPTAKDTAFDGEFPDWLDSLDSKTGMTGKLENMPEWIDEHATPGSSGTENSLDWLSTLGDTPETQSADTDWAGGTDEGVSDLGQGIMGGLSLDPEDSFITEAGRNKTPDWLQGLQEEPESETYKPADDYPGFQATWGFGDQPKSEPRERPVPEQNTKTDALSASEESTTPGGLPSWVKAFRPMEGVDIATEHVEGELERVGPLAGLRDLLSPEADITKTTKPPTYSEVLQVSTRQQTNTQLLQALVESERVPQLAPMAASFSSQRVFRVVFAIIMLLALLFPLLGDTQITPLPQSLPSEIQSVENLTIGAPLDRPILVAFDYEPGTSGELEAAARALFDQWLDRGIPLALVSTSPVGTALGERQVAYLQSQYPYSHAYKYGENYVNLGYIPGGTAGLANFALIPRQSVRMAFDSRPLWELGDYEASNPWRTPVMQTITGVGDFFMTVLLTDNPETARNWIEQVEPYLRRNSLVVVTSAQAEPFIRPYYENPDPSQRQVEGLLVGLRGGAAYEQNQGQLGIARFYWDAYSLGLLVAVLLIVLGGGYNYLDEMRKVQRQARKGKKS